MEQPFSFEDLEIAYKVFRAKLFEEIKELKSEKDSIEINISKLRSDLKTLSGVKKDPLFLLDNEAFFKSIDAFKEMDDLFEALKNFKKININNSSVPLICAQIFESEAIKSEAKRLETEIDKLELRSIELKEKMDFLESVKIEKFVSFDKILECIKKYDFDTLTYRKIVLYFLLKKSKVVKKEKKEEVNEKQDEKDDIKNKNDEEKILELEISIELENNKRLFGEVIKRYDSLLKANNELLNKYYNIIQNLSSGEEYLKVYADNSSDFDFGEEYDYAAIRVLALKVFKAKESVEEEISSVNAGECITAFDIEFTEELIKEFQSLCDKLKGFDKKIIAEEEDNKTNETTNVYFLTDINGNIAMDLSDFNMLQACKKIAGYSQVDSFIKKSSISSKKASKLLNRNVVIQRIDQNVLLTYVKTSINGINAILILTGFPVKVGYKKSCSEIESIVEQNVDLINTQIQLIENQNEEYLKLQELLTESFSDEQKL